MGIVCYEEKVGRKPDKSINSSNNYKSYEKEKEIKEDKLKQNNIQINENSEKRTNKKKEINVLNSLYNEVLKKHNEIRKKHNCANLELNINLTILAQKYADNFDILDKSNFPIENFNNQPLGFNYTKFNGEISNIKKICDDWINEGKNIDKNNKKYSSKTKHFTQIIWKKTKEIGIGLSELNNGEKIFVVYYSPAGNIFNEFKDNIKF